MNKISNQLRQGDVLLTPAVIPASAVEVRRKRRLVLAEGEVTGHAHVINAPLAAVKLYQDEGQLYLRVLSPVTLTHEEHAALPVVPGEYVLRRQVEVWLEEVRQVMD